MRQLKRKLSLFWYLFIFLFLPTSALFCLPTSFFERDSSGTLVLTRSLRLPLSVKNETEVHYFTLPEGTAVSALSHLILKERETIGLPPSIPLDQRDSLLNQIPWYMNQEVQLFSPMSSVVIHLFVSPGQLLYPDTRYCLLEAMKMQCLVCAGTEGKVTKIFFKERDHVSAGAPLLSLSPTHPLWTQLSAQDLALLQEAIVPLFPFASPQLPGTLPFAKTENREILTLTAAPPIPFAQSASKTSETSQRTYGKKTFSLQEKAFPPTFREISLATKGGLPLMTQRSHFVSSLLHQQRGRPSVSSALPEMPSYLCKRPAQAFSRPLSSLEPLPSRSHFKIPTEKGKIFFSKALMKGGLDAVSLLGLALTLVLFTLGTSQLPLLSPASFNSYAFMPSHLPQNLNTPRGRRGFGKNKLKAA